MYWLYAACVRVNEDDERGRYSSARHHLDVGTVVARERSLASVLFPDRVRHKVLQTIKIPNFHMSNLMSIWGPQRNR